MLKKFVIVLNCGSSSIKFAAINPESGDNPLSGLVQCIGQPEANMRWKYQGEKQQKELANVQYEEAILHIIGLLRASNGLFENIIAVGHRVVHGGEHFTQSALVDNKVLATIEGCSHLAPLHNPANVIGIKAAKKAFPNLAQVAVFDTAFHQTMPQHAYMYAVPYEYYERYAVRRYGFHGTSHLYVTREAARRLNKPLEDSAFISAHLGNGCSVAAVLNGKSMDTSMGLTPLEGLVMGTRSGDVDPSLHGFLAEKLGIDVFEVTNILNKKSGLLGISGQTSDMRGIETAAQEKDEKALLAEDVFCYRLAKYIASYTVALSRLDAVIFTGGIGENSPIIREKVLKMLKIFGFELNAKANQTHGVDNSGIISQNNGPMAMVIPTNEELIIARDAAALAKK